MIELKNVTKKYGDFKALDDISFKIEKGEIVGFLGKNGAGKSTTLKIIAGILEPTEGTVLINGEKYNKKNKIKIGYMAENAPLYEGLTVREFIDFMGEMRGIKKRERKIQVNELIEKLSLKDAEKKLIKNLSKGYRQRASLAGALIGNPEILILDEPSIGLDPKQIIEFRELIKSLKEKYTVIMSSHILTEVSQICERVIIIEGGKILAIDTPEKLEKEASKNIIDIVAEPADEKVFKLKDEISGITSIQKIGKGTKKEQTYRITVNDGDDIRGRIIEVSPKLDIKIIELKKNISTLEDVFMNLVDEED